MVVVVVALVMADGLLAQIHLLPLDVRVDFLTRALTAARAELRNEKQQQWREATLAAGLSRLRERLAARDLPCWSALDVDDVPPGVVKTALAWKTVCVQVYINEDEGIASALGPDYLGVSCGTHDEILHDKDNQLHVDHFVMTAYLDICDESYDIDTCEFATIASTNCANYDDEDLESICRNMNISRGGAGHVTYCQGDLRMFRYDFISTSA